MRYMSILALMAFGPGAVAMAEQPIWSAEAGVSSILIDRGEQLAGLNLETSIGVEYGSLFAGIYRISPFGDDREAFAEEVDYTVGAVFATELLEVVVAANWLTFPGAAGESTLELDAEVVANAPWAPGIYVWTAPEFEDRGLELFAGPEMDVGDLTLFGLGRLGSVDLSEGEDYHYWGVEAGAVKSLGTQAEAALFVRYEAASEPLFAREISGREVISNRDDGLALGLRLSAALGGP